jgi:catechol 2,3-dioxygenase-like lactoylglutathione lyase family enzyme
MITGVHAMLYTKDADADRAFLRDVLGFPAVDSGDGWLIFALPPAEMGVHPHDRQMFELHLMCDDVEATIRDLAAKGVACKPPTDQGWGVMTSVPLPSGGFLGLYEPRHPTTLEMERPAAARRSGRK